MLYFVPYLEYLSNALQQIGMAVETNGLEKQYVDLGNLSMACIVVPETCGTEGGAVAVRVKVNVTECTSYCGIISSVAYTSGLSIFYSSTYLL